MTAPDPAFVVQQQVFPPGPPPPDAITVYDGADPAKGQNFSFRAWDLRGPILRIVWDLLRFRKIGDGKQFGADATVPHGLYDWVLYTAYLTNQNNQILRKLAQVGNIDISAITNG